LPGPVTDRPARLPEETRVRAQERILELPGQRAFSAFRLSKREARLKAADGRIGRLEARYSYFVAASQALADSEQALLESLLLGGDAAHELPEDAQTVLVVPRFGTISPWSSKATDIVHACGLAAVGQPRAGPGAVRRRDRLPARELPAHRAQSDRRRADDVRAGELRALPPQDLQRRLGHRRRTAADKSLFGMIRNTTPHIPGHVVAYSTTPR
jgi:hypothetical protein